MSEVNSGQTGLADAHSSKLMVNGYIHAKKLGCVPVEVRRGLNFYGRDGQEVGTVAAVVLDCDQGCVTHLLLGQVPPTAVYRLVPVGLVELVDGETIRLAATAEDVEKLPLYHPDV